MSKRGAHVIHSTGDKGTGDGKGGTLRKARKINNEEGHFGKGGAPQAKAKRHKLFKSRPGAKR